MIRIVYLLVFGLTFCACTVRVEIRPQVTVNTPDGGITLDEDASARLWRALEGK